MSLRFVLIGAYAIAAYFILKSQFTTAILLTGFGALLVLSISQKRKWINMVIGVVLLIILILSYRSILTYISELSQKMKASFVSEKLRMLLSAEQSENVESLARYQSYMESIEAFFKNPIKGSGSSGGHSQIFDPFSSIGVFAVPYVIFLIVIFRKIREYVVGLYAIILELAVLVLAVFNPIAGSTIISITFMLVPTMLLCSSKKEDLASETDVCDQEER